MQLHISYVFCLKNLIFRVSFVGLDSRGDFISFHSFFNSSAAPSQVLLLGRKTLIRFSGLHDSTEKN